VPQVTFLKGHLAVRLAAPGQADICFNICEGHFGDSREAQVPALLEMLRIPYTGSRVLTLALALDKPMTKRVLAITACRRRPSRCSSGQRAARPDMQFPMFVKPSREGTGMGSAPSRLSAMRPSCGCSSSGSWRATSSRSWPSGSSPPGGYGGMVGNLQRRGQAGAGGRGCVARPARLTYLRR